MRHLTQAMIGLALLALAGCSSDTPTQTMTDEQKQAAILADPMGYRPQVGGDITGGSDISHVGNGLDKDVNDVLNP